MHGGDAVTDMPEDQHGQNRLHPQGDEEEEEEIEEIFHDALDADDDDDNDDRTMTLFAVSAVSAQQQQHARGKYLETTIDSGCGRSVCPTSLAAGRTIEETKQSRAGHVFTGPGGERYPNRGRVTIRGVNDEERKCQVSFNVAEGVRQALGSVAECNDAGNIAIFDSSGEHSGSILLTAASEADRVIRRAVELAQKAGAGSRMHRVGNTYVTKIWMEEPSEMVNSPGFAGRGR